MNSLITGASGFIAAHLARRLAREGHTLHGLIRSTSNRSLLEGVDIQWIKGDVTDPNSLTQAFRNMDVVFHLAGLTKAVRPSSLFEVNGQGTLHVAEACVRCGVSKLIHVSSLAAAGPSRPGRKGVNGAARTESDLPQPVSNYGHSKLQSEQVLYRFADQLEMTILRPPIVIGEGDTASLQIFSAIQKTHVHAVPWPTSRLFSVIHAEDLAELIVRAASDGERITREGNSHEALGNGIYFADMGNSLTYGQLGQKMAKAMNVKCRIVPVPRIVLLGAGLTGDVVGLLTGKASFISFDKAREATVRGMWVCDGAKARNAFAFEPQISLENRLVQTFQWYRQHKLL